VRFDGTALITLVTVDTKPSCPAFCPRVFAWFIWVEKPKHSLMVLNVSLAR
jgi:hypothetical protein